MPDSTVYDSANSISTPEVIVSLELTGSVDVALFCLKYQDWIHKIRHTETCVFCAESNNSYLPDYLGRLVGVYNIVILLTKYYWRLWVSERSSPAAR